MLYRPIPGMLRQLKYRVPTCSVGSYDNRKSYAKSAY